jgi:hypothetical protein
MKILIVKGLYPWLEKIINEITGININDADDLSIKNAISEKVLEKTGNYDYYNEGTCNYTEFFAIFSTEKKATFHELDNNSCFSRRVQRTVPNIRKQLIPLKKKPDFILEVNNESNKKNSMSFSLYDMREIDFSCKK